MAEKRKKSKVLEEIAEKYVSKLGEPLKNFHTGVTRLPYRTLGGSVDLMTAAMRPFGYGVEKPVMGSEGLIDQGIGAGIAAPRTGTLAELGGDFLGGLVDPTPTTEMA